MPCQSVIEVYEKTREDVGKCHGFLMPFFGTQYINERPHTRPQRRFLKKPFAIPGYSVL